MLSVPDKSGLTPAEQLIALIDQCCEGHYSLARGPRKTTKVSALEWAL
jgi:hypothetical protein